jgi:uncharacterized LabA/DUF88 family protein
MNTFSSQAEAPVRPSTPRVHAFVDGQNLFYGVKRCFGYEFPNFDIMRLAEELVSSSDFDRELLQVHFYTGMHRRANNEFWHDFWTKKLTAMRGQGVRVVTIPLMYIRIDAPGGSVNKGVEKGIDLRIGLDLVRLARRNEFDVALVFSQDNDLSEAVKEIKELRRELNRWIVVESAFPSNPALGVQRGIPGTQWRPFGKDIYDRCIDPGDYRTPREPLASR